MIIRQFELNESQLNNLNIFMQRVDLRGLNEASALVELANIFFSIEKKEEEEKAIEAKE